MTKNTNLLSAAAALLIALTMAPLSAQTISIGVAANFATPLMSIITAFRLAHDDTDYTISLTSAATGVLQSAITTGGATGPYDLFLAANQAAPLALSNSSSTLYGTPFTYAKGSLMLWSPTGADVSAGLPLPLAQNLTLADPTTAPYGLAAKQVLSNVYGITLPHDYVTVGSNIDATYLSIKNGVYPMGFIAKSQICTNGAITPNTPGTYLEYTSGHDPIIQDGIEINRTRSAADTAAVEDFIAFLRTSTAAQALIVSYCYTYPAT